jgi:hypothetical protein
LICRLIVSIKDKSQNNYGQNYYSLNGNRLRKLF